MSSEYFSIASGVLMGGIHFRKLLKCLLIFGSGLGLMAQVSFVFFSRVITVVRWSGFSTHIL